LFDLNRDIFTFKRNTEMKICIVGGGNGAHALASTLGQRGDLDVYVLTRKPNLWGSILTAIDSHDNKIVGKIKKASNNAVDVIPQADIILISLPFFALNEIMDKISPYIKSNAWVGAFPGLGGFYWLARKKLGQKIKLFGTQRVPYISRTIDYGKELSITSIRNNLFVASSPAKEFNRIASILEQIFNIPIIEVNNFLGVALTPSNPILHTSRLYGLFHNWNDEIYWREKILFYEEWDNTSSDILLKCDEEVQNICANIPLDLSCVISLKKHYNATNRHDMTQSISGIYNLKGITAPMILLEHGYVPDFTSRYFIEDFPHGIIFIKSIAELVSCPVPTIDKVIRWAQGHLKKEYILGDKLKGSDINEASTIGAYGILTIEQLLGSLY
jgi:hypothetical protein